jgi:arylsulfatase A-like enzyme
MWCKHCNFKTSLNAPLIFRVPDQRGGVSTDAIVEFIDIYPTLCDLAGLPVPSGLPGMSLAPSLDDPDVRVKGAAFSRWYDGESVRTDDYLFTEWVAENGTAEERMMYDHQRDPGENLNIAVHDEHEERMREFSKMLGKVRREKDRYDE